MKNEIVKQTEITKRRKAYLTAIADMKKELKKGEKLYSAYLLMNPKTFIKNHLSINN